MYGILTYITGWFLTNPTYLTIVALPGTRTFWPFWVEQSAYTTSLEWDEQQWQRACRIAAQIEQGGAHVDDEAVHDEADTESRVPFEGGRDAGFGPAIRNKRLAACFWAARLDTLLRAQRQVLQQVST